MSNDHYDVDDWMLCSGDDEWTDHKGDNRFILKIVAYGVLSVVVAAAIGIPLLAML